MSELMIGNGLVAMTANIQIYAIKVLQNHYKTFMQDKKQLKNTKITHSNNGADCLEII